MSNHEQLLGEINALAENMAQVGVQITLHALQVINRHRNSAHSIKSINFDITSGKGVNIRISPGSEGKASTTPVYLHKEGAIDLLMADSHRSDREQVSEALKALQAGTIAYSFTSGSHGDLTIDGSLEPRMALADCAKTVALINAKSNLVWTELPENWRKSTTVISLAMAVDPHVALADGYQKAIDNKHLTDTPIAGKLFVDTMLKMRSLRVHTPGLANLPFLKNALSEKQRPALLM